ncbi:hypothetical protein [Ruegeria atlantica]|uniref:Uncharacterized protein n=1 Tax=Ruegeria atlantica TaxID=81569 RepID=A0ABX1WE30_9RHOB|nr:hypothetical protein [Ruegeria atlantica]NOD31487.1 hypothetical protein [Ruegeria atlantica]
MNNQTRKDLGQVQDILEQRIHELTHGDDYAFRADPLPKLKGNFWTRLPLTFLLMATKGVLMTSNKTEKADTHPTEAMRV